MLSRSSFKAELQKVRKAPGWRPSADIDLLDRWLAADGVEKLWKAISGTPPRILPLDLIESVLKAHRKAVGTMNEIYGVTLKERSSAKVRVFEPERDREFERAISHQEKKNWAAIKKQFGVKRLAIPKTVRVVQGTLSKPRVVDFDPVHIDGLQEEWAALKKRLSDNLSERNLKILAKSYDLHIAWRDAVGEFKLSRQDEGGTRVLRLFWQIIGDYLQAKCGRWFDVEVAKLTEIAFDLRVDPTQISDARKQRSKKTH
jgi:hypothetical protein